MVEVISLAELFETGSEQIAIRWPSPPAGWKLGLNEAHVWAVSLQANALELAVFTTVLSPDERARADRFQFERDKNRFIVARGSLRFILSRYARRAPDVLQFDYTPNGKPQLRQNPASRPLHFNVSHSEDLALIAVTALGDIGVDVERQRPIEEQAIAERFFSLCEKEILASVSIEQHSETFFQLWTQKEARLKATGSGLGELEKPMDGANHQLADLAPAEGFVGALAVRADAPKILCWHWQSAI